MRTVEIDGFKLGYHIEGRGIPVIVVGSCHYYPKLFSEELRQHLQLVFIDHRGFSSPPPSTPQSAYELETILDDVEQIRRRLNLGPAVIMGHSGHAYMALEYAKRYPQNASHVVMIAAAPNLGPENQKEAERAYEKLASSERREIHEKKMQHLSEKIEAAPERRFITFCLCNEAKTWYDPHFDSAYLWEGVTVNHAMIDYVWGKVFRDIDITQGLESFERPVFLALGRYDFLAAPPSTWEPLRHRFLNLTQIVFEKSGHNPQFEEAARFDRELLRWISSNSQDPDYDLESVL